MRCFACDHAGRHQLDVFARLGRDGGRLARRAPIVEQALRYPVAPRYQTNFATFRVDLGQQFRLLLRAPNPPPLRRSQHIYGRQNRLLLESRERLQISSPNVADAATRRRPDAYV
jgi:hypothetical protein